MHRDIMPQCLLDKIYLHKVFVKMNTLFSWASSLYPSLRSDYCWTSSILCLLMYLRCINELCICRPSRSCNQTKPRHHAVALGRCRTNPVPESRQPSNGALLGFLYHRNLNMLCCLTLSRTKPFWLGPLKKHIQSPTVTADMMWQNQRSRHRALPKCPSVSKGRGLIASAENGKELCINHKASVLLLFILLLPPVLCTG